MSENLLQKWAQVTGALPWAKQRVLHDTLNLVAMGEVKVVWGQDSFMGSPCLINAVGCMVKSEDESPSMNEPALVNVFDRINREIFAPAGIVTDKFLSELGAEILLRNFAPLKEIPKDETPSVVEAMPYREPRDKDFEKMLQEGFEKPAPVEVQDEETLAEVLRDIE